MPPSQRTMFSVLSGKDLFKKDLRIIPWGGVKEGMVAPPYCMDLKPAAYYCEHAQIFGKSKA